MKMQFGLNLVQTQKLVMTPELRQAIEILQYNSIELHEFIQDQLVTNPVLELNQGSESAEKSADQENVPEPVQKTAEQIAQEILNNRKELEWKDWGQEDSSNWQYRSSEEQENYSFENYVATEKTLTEHLLEQLQFVELTEVHRLMGVYIIENISANGYLSQTNGEIAQFLGADEDAVEDIIQIIQTFEPFGVGARDLKECLLIQVQHLNPENPYVIPIIENHLEDLASNRMSVMAKVLATSTEEIQDASDFIRSLEPKPGRVFASLRDVRYVIPDVTIEKVGQEYVVLVNDQAAPRLRISTFYQSILRDAATEENASTYISERLQSALKIIRSIEQRRNTIYKVVQSIVETQQDFFDKGMLYLKPMTLKDIAEQVGVHESTVSRAVNGKYVQSPRGVYELKYFFQSGVSSSDGEGVSSQSIKAQIGELIQKEDSRKPISDQQISDVLNGNGVRVSRRTIAKYREEMGIPGSSKRRRY